MDPSRSWDQFRRKRVRSTGSKRRRAKLAMERARRRWKLLMQSMHKSVRDRFRHGEHGDDDASTSG